jgi:hypothetical protein
MNQGTRNFMLIALLFCVSVGRAQEIQDNICYVNNDVMYLQLDNRWSDARKKEIAALYNIDSLLMVQAFAGKINTSDSLIWSIATIDDHIVRLSKSLACRPSSCFNPTDVVLLDDKFLVAQPPAVPINPQWQPIIFPPIFGITFGQPKPYGINEFRKKVTVKAIGDSVTFFLPGYTEIKQVYLSGTFNNWSTMQLPMQKVPSGWQVSIRVPPGKYLYKFITDGRWIHDPYNKQKEHDGQGDYNSVFYSYNHVFTLDGYLNARRVILAGSFNNWNTSALKMNPTGSGWELPIYLEDGTYAYKFIVDGEWITDPANKNYRADASGNLNSFMGIGDSIVFRLSGFDSASQVVLTGSFNRWSTNELVMNKVKGGWELPYILGKGYYEYKFIVDGEWMPDPANPSNVGSGDYTNSYIIIGANYTFKLAGFSDASKVIVTGSFNGWQTESYRMNKTSDGWVFSAYLKPGKYTYKFIVDGTWLLDPANELWEPNAEGTGNSVLWIEP